MRETVRRFVDDESGMTMALAIIMIVLLSVMGVGLLTFADRNLNTVSEANRGQRAFEMADAGVAAAKRELARDCSTTTNCVDHYDDLSSEVVGTPDSSQWSAVNGGVTLNDLDGDGLGGTQDSVSVTIFYRHDKPDFKIVSTGDYGVSKRKIEATFKGVSGSCLVGCTGLGLPNYFTPSAIRIEDPLTLNGLSLFSETDILINNSTNTDNPGGLTTPADFIKDYEGNANNSYLTIGGTGDELGNWDSTQFAAPNTGTWNTVGRTGGDPSLYKTCKGNGPCTKAGLAALGKICGWSPSSTTTATCGSATSVADGVYGYDSTTGTTAGGNHLQFVSKSPPTLTPQPSGTITFPFPRPTPNAAALRGYAQQVPGNQYFAGVPTTTQWDAWYSNSSTANQVVFIDAQGGTVNFNPTGNNNNKGILVVWCGDLQLNKKFQGIILNLWPNGSVNSQLPGGSNCTDSRGIVTNNGQDFSGWLYAQGGNATTPGIRLRRSNDATTMPSMNTLPSGTWSFYTDFFSGGPPTSVVPQSWRELYQ
jgi:Flp pilus assembly pilin Flp